MHSNRKPAKGGSKEHHRRISEGLREHYANKPRGTKPTSSRRPGILSRWLASRKHPDNLWHKKLRADVEYKNAIKAVRKAEGDLAASFRLSSEKRTQIRNTLVKAKQAADVAMASASKRTKR